MSPFEKPFGDSAALKDAVAADPEPHSSGAKPGPDQSPREIDLANIKEPAAVAVGAEETPATIGSALPTGTVPAPLGVPKTLDMLRETRIKDSDTAWSSFVGHQTPQLMFYGSKQKVVRISAEDWRTPENWFLLGDIHGDFYALSNAVRWIRETCPDFRLVFLGDLVDRGRHPMECLWFLVNLAKEFPQRILWLAGNHDDSVSKDGDRFRSSVFPSEFLEHLNTVDSWTPFRRGFGLEYIDLVAGLPRAALSPDGLLMTHGGFPHTDLQKNLMECTSDEERQSWLNSPQAVKDFTWTRITRYRAKIPNRVSTGCSYGFADFDSFCKLSKDFFPAERLVTGHDHPDGGFDKHPEWVERKALTLTGFGFQGDSDDPRSFNERYQEYLVVGRCRANDIPEVVTIPVDREDLAQYFSEELAPKFTNRG